MQLITDGGGYEIFTPVEELQAQLYRIERAARTCYQTEKPSRTQEQTEAIEAQTMVLKEQAETLAGQLYVTI